MITPNAHTPVGTVISYAGPLQDNPSHNHGFPAPGLAAYAYHLKRAGWLPCDGRTLPVAGYRELFRAIGFIHGRSGKGFFRLPDYRGRFLRGVNLDAKTDDGAFRDPDRESRDPGADGGWAGNAVGSVQEDALRKHWHFYDRAKAGALAAEGSPVYSTKESVASKPSSDLNENPGNKDTFAGQETRAKNAYVHFLIKFAHPRCAVRQFLRPGFARHPYLTPYQGEDNAAYLTLFSDQ